MKKDQHDIVWLNWQRMQNNVGLKQKKNALLTKIWHYFLFFYGFQTLALALPPMLIFFLAMTPSLPRACTSDPTPGKLYDGDICNLYQNYNVTNCL